ncbi:MAG: DUF4252 domain-containing protein [Tannerellaceae bacterium]|jgi:hypothetical protein|nr:DUF4252 domain-containing protein [Tannerellaceae bacterium]
MKAIIPMLCLLLATPGIAQSKLFDKYADNDNVKSVYISKAMFDMIPMIGDVGMSLTNLKGKIESLQLLSADRKELASQMRSEFSQLVSKHHTDLMHVRDGKSRVNFYSSGSGEHLKDLILIIDSDTAYTVMQILGNFTLKDIQGVIKDIQ